MEGWTHETTISRLEAENARLRADVETLKRVGASDLLWAMDKNAVLILALRHEVFGNEPCAPDCEPGGWRKCTGCDKRAKDALLGNLPGRR